MYSNVLHPMFLLDNFYDLAKQPLVKFVKTAEEIG